MRSKEALEYLEDIYEHEEGELRPYDDPIGKKIDYKEEFDILRKLVERDTPKKVCYDNLGRSECPSCDKSYLHNRSMNRNIYCGYCGQRLDWSELEKEKE